MVKVNPFIPFIPRGLFYLDCLDRCISSKGVFGYFLLKPYFIEIVVFNTDGVDPDQTPLARVYAVCQRPFYGTLGIHESVTILSLHIRYLNLKSRKLPLETKNTKNNEKKNL